MIAVLMLAEATPTALSGRSTYAGALSGDGFRTFLDSEDVIAYRSLGVEGGYWAAMVLAERTSLDWTANGPDGDLRLVMSKADVPAEARPTVYQDPRAITGALLGFAVGRLL